MNLTDIQHALEEILRLNPSINKERLTTLLVASGWEKRNVNEALLIYETITPDLPAPAVIPEDHLLPEATVVPSFDGIDSTISHKDTFTVPLDVEQKKDVQEEVVVDQTPVSTPEVTSLVEEEVKDASPRPEKETPSIPENLPVQPFATSPHFWSFARYRDLFHRWGSHEDAEKNADTPDIVLAQPSPILIRQQPEVSLQFTPHVVVAHEPLSQKDKNLVITASLLLLVILLMLGYMYSQGRL